MVQKSLSQKGWVGQKAIFHSTPPTSLQSNLGEFLRFRHLSLSSVTKLLKQQRTFDPIQLLGTRGQGSDQAITNHGVKIKKTSIDAADWV